MSIDRNKIEKGFRQAVFGGLAIVFAFGLSGCAGGDEPSPDIHKKTYTLSELEAKYRTLNKKPASYADDTSSITAQERQFYREVQNTFHSIDEYKYGIEQATKITLKKQREAERKLKIKRQREAERRRAAVAEKRVSEVKKYYSGKGTSSKKGGGKDVVAKYY